MRLIRKLIPKWPKLAWVAVFANKSVEINLYHGPMMEISDQWAVEAVWAGEFAVGDFDRTDLVFGSGVRCRGDKVVFVSSGTGVDRLWYCCRSDCWYISNSLPALLAAGQLSLLEDYENYSNDIQTVERRGLKHYRRTLPAKPGDITVLYFDNLIYDGHSVREVAKPNNTGHFASFQDYFEFLKETAQCVGANLNCAQRKYNIVPLASISSGYDGAAAAVISKYAGCTRAATIHQSKSLWRGSDSGERIAQYLNMSCDRYDRVPAVYPHEITIWAATGLSGGRNLTVFDYPEPLCLFFSGSYGDKVWDRFYHDLSEPVGDRDHFLGEFRLFKGMFQCVVPWWGIRRAQEINALGSTEELAPWTLHNNYDRPIARCILEEAGVPRDAFGMRKRDTSSNVEFLWPHSADAKASFEGYLRSRGVYTPAPWMISLIRRIAFLDNLIYINILRKCGLRKSLKTLLKFRANSLLFHWANSELKDIYAQGLKAEESDSNAKQPIAIDMPRASAKIKNER